MPFFELFSSPRNRLIGIGILTGMLLIGSVTRYSNAHIVTEKPWFPIAASYRSMMFLGDLDPVPWDKIQKAFEKPHPAAINGLKSARARLIELSKLENETAILLRGIDAKVSQAIETQNRNALYATATKALSLSIRTYLAVASGEADNPGDALKNVINARSIYRALEDFIRQANPEMSKKIGRAWLILSSASGHRGILGKGHKAIDHEAFEKARKTIETYLKDNFEASGFTKRNSLTPLPEKLVRTIGENKAASRIAAWLPPGSNINDQEPLPLLVLNFEEKGIDETKVPLVAYGDMLFDSAEIFGPVARNLGVACSTCHNRSDINQSFFIPGVSHQPGAADVDGGFFNPEFNDHRNDSLDIPSLRGLRFTAPYGRDGRFQSLREFTRNVIVSEFNGPEPTAYMLDALVAYMLEFDFLPNSKIDHFGRLKKTSSEAAKRGEILFNTPFKGMADQSCASCHIPTANFIDKRQHNIGSESKDYKNSLGGSFDTPTLLGTRFTAPYFHDGSLPTLASVVNWFDNQFSLDLSNQQKADLTAYLETIGGADTPYEKFTSRKTPFRLGFDELMTFVSTLDTLLPKQDAFHAELLLRTISIDLKADASGMTNLKVKAKVYELATQLEDILSAIKEKDWLRAERSWASFKVAKEIHDKTMY